MSTPDTHQLGRVGSSGPLGPSTGYEAHAGATNTLTGGSTQSADAMDLSSSLPQASQMPSAYGPASPLIPRTLDQTPSQQLVFTEVRRSISHSPTAGARSSPSKEQMAATLMQMEFVVQQLRSEFSAAGAQYKGQFERIADTGEYGLLRGHCIEWQRWPGQ